MGLERTEAAKGETGASFTEFISGIAAKANLKVQVKSPDLVVVPFDMGEGRFQNTFVRPMGKTGAGHFIVSFFSPALKMPADQGGLGQKAANDLLRKNSQLPHGGWAIDRVDNDDYLGMIDTLIAQTMDPEEFYASCLALAKIADDFEKTMGVDVF